MAEGDIGAVIDTLEFDAVCNGSPRIVQVDGNVFVIAYPGPGGDGFLKTVTINTDGQIDNAAIDTLEFDADTAFHLSIIHVSGSVYAIAYRGVDLDGYLKTVTIHTDGLIDNTVIDTLEFDISDGAYPNIVHASGSVYAIAYQGSGGDGYLKTVTIHTDGLIDDTVIDSLEFDASDCVYPNIIHITGSVYAIAYKGVGGDGYLKTVTIHTNGQIDDTVIDTLEFEQKAGSYLNIIHISGSVYAIAYEGVGGDGFVKTVTINTDGLIDDTVIDTLEFEVNACT